MRVKAVSILVLVVLCLSSLLTVLAPPLAHLAEAAPMQTLTVSGGVPNILQVGNVRSFSLEASSKVVQFTRPNLTVGSNASGVFGSVTKLIWPVTGGLTGAIAADVNIVSVTWDGLPSGTAKGYGIHTFTFDDGNANTFGGIMVVDLDINNALPYPSAIGRIVSTSGTGAFSGKKLIGTLSGYTDGTWTATLRCYSASEISAAQAFTGTGSLSGGGGGSLGTSIGSLNYDEWVQFGEANVTAPKDTYAWYGSGTNVDGPVTGALTGILSQSVDGCWVFPDPATARGWSVGKFSFSSGSGTITGIGIAGSSPGQNHLFALREAATGSYTGRDYYATLTAQLTGDPNNPSGVSYTGSLYTLTPGVAVATASGTGTAAFASTSGVIENLTAVAESSMPTADKPDIDFPHGFFEFEITGLTPGQSVTLTITLPSAVPTTAQYWKYGPTPSNPTPHWYQIPMGDNDGDNVITITLVDGGLGDDDLAADGIIVDQGGPGWPGPSGGGGRGVPTFPSIWIGIAAALGVGALAYFLRRRLAAHS